MHNHYCRDTSSGHAVMTATEVFVAEAADRELFLLHQTVLLLQYHALPLEQCLLQELKVKW